jgi:hypothetical protein
VPAGARGSQTCDRGACGEASEAVARVLIVGGEERGGALAGALLDRAYAVRVVHASRVPARVERFAADPDRPGTLKAALEQVTIACWLFGSAGGEEERVAALHGARLERFLHQTIDSSVRGLLYEAAGSVSADVLARGRTLVSDFAEQNAVPLALLVCEPSALERWLEHALEAIDALVGRYPSSIYGNPIDFRP